MRELYSSRGRVLHVKACGGPDVCSAAHLTVRDLRAAVDWVPLDDALLDHILALHTRATLQGTD